MPVLLDLGAVFVAFCAFLVCWCLLQAYSATLGALLGHLADVTKRVSVAGIHVFGWLGSGLDHINHFIMLQMGNAVEGTAWAWHQLIGQLAKFVYEVPHVLNDLALASAQAWDFAYRHGIRQIVTVYTNPLWATLHALQTLVHALEHAGGTTVKVVTRVVVHDLPRVTVRVEHNVTRIVRVEAKAAVGALAHPIPRIGALERDFQGIDRLAKDAWRKLSKPLVFAGLVAAALTHLGLEWLRCSNYQRFGKKVCQIHPNVLDNFLLGLLAVFGTIELIPFAKNVQSAFSTVAPDVTHFWRSDKLGAGGDRQLGSPTLN